MRQAYDLICEIVHELSTPDDNMMELRTLLVEIDKTDDILAGIIRDRTKS